MTRAMPDARRNPSAKAGLAVAALAILPLVMGLLNLRAMIRPPRRPVGQDRGVSVLIPARNEAAQIEAAIDAVLANGNTVKEVIVLDDHSTDDTAALVRAYVDSRVRLLTGRPLPPGWCGKNHACAQLAEAATQPWLFFIDADVRLAPEAVSRLLGMTENGQTPAMISGVPNQDTVSVMEWLLLPFINVLLYGYLPLMMDTGRSPGLAAACGQLVFIDANAYRRTGGHAGIRNRLHDGLALARAMRRHGHKTTLIDATDLATCRMYRSGREVYDGLMKNAVEGLAGPVALPVWTVLLAGGHIAPFLMRATPAIWLARFASLGFRLIVALRCRQGLRTVIASPIGTFLLLFIQFHARIRHVLGRPVSWKGRHYET